MITVYRVDLDGDEYYGRDMEDVQWLLEVKGVALVNGAPETLRIIQTKMSEAEFDALPEWRG